MPGKLCHRTRKKSVPPFKLFPTTNAEMIRIACYVGLIIKVFDRLKM